MDKSSIQIRSLFLALITIGYVIFALPVQGQQLAATVQLPNGVSPTSFALDAADDLLFVAANAGSAALGSAGAVYAIYIPNPSIVGTASLPGQPNYSNALAYSPATGQLYALKCDANWTGQCLHPGICLQYGSCRNLTICKSPMELLKVLRWLTTAAGL
jgi:hypothetical protein